MNNKLKTLFAVAFLMMSVNLNAADDNFKNLSNHKDGVQSVSVDKVKAADFSLQGVDGSKINLSDFAGKIVIVDFWATWCGPCRKGVPDLVSLQKEFKDDLVVIGISLDQGSTIANIKPFMKEYGINYPVVYGTQQVVVDYGNIRGIPTSFIIDQNGFIADRHIGLVPAKVYRETIKSLLGK